MWWAGRRIKTGNELNMHGTGVFELLIRAQTSGSLELGETDDFEQSILAARGFFASLRARRQRRGSAVNQRESCSERGRV